MTKHIQPPRGDLNREEAYFVWLYSHMARPYAKNLSKRWWTLARMMHSRPFEWDEEKIPLDSNRAGDGRSMREYFIREYERRSPGLDDPWVNGEAPSVFEVFIAFANRFSYVCMMYPGDTAHEILLTNMGLYQYTDANPPSEDDAGVLIDNFVYRRYNDWGEGGCMFVVPNSPVDLRDYEIWRQVIVWNHIVYRPQPWRWYDGFLPNRARGEEEGRV